MPRFSTEAVPSYTYARTDRVENTWKTIWVDTTPAAVEEAAEAPAEPIAPHKANGFVKGKPRKSPKSGRFYTVWHAIQTTKAEIQSRLRLERTTVPNPYDRTIRVSYQRALVRLRTKAKAAWCPNFTLDAECQRKASIWSGACAEIQDIRQRMRAVSSTQLSVKLYWPHLSDGRHKAFLSGGRTPAGLAQALGAARRFRSECKRNSRTRESRGRMASGLHADMGLTNDPRVEGVHHEHGWFLKQVHTRNVRSVASAKMPNTTECYVGVELEFFSPFDRPQISNVIAKAGLQRQVNPTGDVSIIPGYDYLSGTEIRLLAKESEAPAVVERTCAVLRELSAGVNKTCGLHVHLDMRSREIAASYEKLFLALDLLYALVPLPRRTNTRYCERNFEPDYATENASRVRYRAINVTSYQKHYTLEVRLHQGTTNATKVNAWIALLTSIVDGPRLKRLPRSTNVMAKIWKWPEELHAYVNSRVLHFADEDQKLPFKVKGPGDERSSRAIYEAGEDPELGNQAEPRQRPRPSAFRNTQGHHQQDNVLRNTVAPEGGPEVPPWLFNYDRAGVSAPELENQARTLCTCAHCHFARQRVRDSRSWRRNDSYTDSRPVLSVVRR